jgi:glutamate-1-semialdehyde 2,1-aminomutase
LLKNDVSKYLDKTKKSHQLYKKAKRIFAGGTSHNARFFEPYPFFVRKAQGKYLWDVDGNKYTDYWTGHTALILGHSPKIVAEALEEQSENGTLFGTVAEQAVELGEIVRSNVPCAKLIRFCNTGAEATMYAVRLARAFTGRRVVAKAEGGWHGYNTTLLKGVTSPFEVPESAGLIEQGNQFVRTFKFNT